MQIVHRLPSSGLLGQWCWAAAIAWLSHRTEHDNLHAAATTGRNAASPVTVCYPSQRRDSTSPWMPPLGETFPRKRQEYLRRPDGAPGRRQKSKTSLWHGNPQLLAESVRLRCHNGG